MGTGTMNIGGKQVQTHRSPKNAAFFDQITSDEYAAKILENKRKREEIRKQNEAPSAKDRAIDKGTDHLQDEATGRLMGNGHSGVAANAGENAAWNAGANAATAGGQAGVQALGQGSAAGTTYVIGAGQSVPAGYTAVGTAANGGTIVAPGANAVASGGTPGFAMGAPSYAGYAGAAIEGYNTYKMLGDDNLTGEQQATKLQQGGALMAADVFTGGAASLGAGFAREQWGGTAGKLDRLDQKTNPGTMLLKNFLNGKGADQIQRDQVRGALVDAGVLGKDFMAKRVYGDDFNFGLDGSVKNYNVDFDDERAAQSVGWAVPLSYIIAGGTQKGHKSHDDWGGEIANYGMQGAGNLDEVKANLNYFLENNLKMNNDQAVGVLKAIKAEGGMSDDEYNKALYGLGTLTGKKAPQAGSPAKPPIPSRNTAPAPVTGVQLPVSSFKPAQISPTLPGARDGAYVVGRDGPAPDWLKGKDIVPYSTAVRR